MAKGTKLGTSVLDLDIDDSRFTKGLDTGEKKAMGFFDRVGAGIKGMFAKIPGGGLITGLGLGAGLGVFNMATAAIGKLTAFVGESVAAASNLAESQNAVNVVFGAAAGKLEAYAKKAAAAAGLSARAFNELVTPIGAMLQNVGFGADKAADASINLAQRAADMASVFNVDVSEALGAIQAGLRGEADPLERFGVGLSDAAVTAHALEMGLAATAGELDANAKTQARLSLLMQQTDKIAGDFANTSDEMANKTRINDARMENLQARIGKGLIPVFDFLGSVMSDVVLPVLDALVTGLGFVGDVIAEVGDAATDMAMNFGDMGDRVHAIADETGISFDAMKDRIQADMAELGLTFDEAAAKAEEDLNTAAHRQREREKIAWAAARAEADALIAERPRLMREAAASAAIPVDEIEARWDDMRAAAYQGVVELAKGLLDAQDAPRVAMDALMQTQTDALSEQAEINRLLGQLNSTELAAGLNDERESVRAAARAAMLAIENRLRELDAWQFGVNIASDLAGGLDSRYGVVRDAAGRLGAAIEGQIGIRSEPSDPTSPMRGVTGWGDAIVDTIADGMDRAVATMRASAERVASAASVAGIRVPTPAMPAMHELASSGSLAAGHDPGFLAALDASAARPIVNVYADFLVAPTAYELHRLGEAAGPAVERYLLRNRRIERRPRN